MLLPVIGLVVIGPYVQADRYTYVSLIGLFVMVVWWLADVLEGFAPRPWVVPGVVLAVMTALAVTSWIQVGYWRNSVTLYQRALAVDDKNLTAMNNLGLAFIYRQEPDAAIPYFNQVLAIDPDNTAALTNLGYIMKERGQAGAAIRLYQKSLAIDPANSSAHNNLGNLFSSQGRLDVAADHFEQALQIDPFHAGTHNNLGTLRVKQGRSEAAFRHFQAALASDPMFAEAYTNRGILWFEKGNLSAALADFSAALRIRPADVSVHSNLAKCLAAMGRFGQAIGHYRRAIEIDPTRPEAHNGMGVICLHQGRYQPAIAYFHRASVLNPANGRFRQNLDRAKKLHRDRTERIAQLERQVEQAPLTVQHYLDLADLLKQTGKYDSALDYYRRALTLDPRNTMVLDHMGILLAVKGDYVAALEALRLSIDHDPDAFEAYYLTAAVYARQDQVIPAVDFLKRAVKKRL